MSREDQLRIAVFGAHPADCVWNSAGTIAVHARNKDRVLVVPVTYGARHCNPFLAPTKEEGYRPLEEVKTRKLDEIRKACKILGADLLQLDFKDQIFVGNNEEIQKITDIIRDFRPDIVITHHPVDTAFSDQPDHATTGTAVMRAVKYANEWGADSTKPGWHVNTVLLWPARHNTAMYRVTPYITPANYYVEITEVIDQKRQALRCLEGSMLATEEAADAIINAMSITVGGAAGVPHAEEYVYTAPFVVKRLSRRESGPHRNMLLPQGWTLEEYERLFPLDR
ncbi:MAG: PIG-L deacetylase family protein [Armatimonadota bacterium]|nr:PIG-L deacetylase family protein [Armatimonadota bacterium]